MATRVRRRRRKPRHPIWHKITIPVAVVIALIAAAGGVGVAWAVGVYNSAPPLSSLKAVEKGRSSAIYAADGSLIGFIRADNIRQPVSGEELPQVLRDATIAIEDKNFYEHGALDYEGIARAAWEDLKAGAAVQGASTITQQLVRNLYIQKPEETIERKIREARLAIELEEDKSKEWIIVSYLNTAPYGTVEGQTAVGAEAAAQVYFSKPADELGLKEAALIAGLPQAPSEYNPFLDPQAAKSRRNEVLAAMYDQDYIDAAEYREAREGGLGLDAGDKYRVIHDPFLFDLVQQQLIERYGINTVRNGGLKAYTTIDPDLQQKAEEAVSLCYVCYPEGGPAAGLASVDPDTGAIVALASTEGYADESQFNFAWQAERQPGSSFKTFVLTTAIKQGIDPDTTYYSGASPMTLELPGGGAPWVVNNSEGDGGGTMNLDSATVHSVNVVYAQLDLDVGPEEVTKTAREMGIKAKLLSVPAEGIGGLTYGVTPLEMADAYATLANGGVHHDPTAISKVVFPDGKVDEIDADEGKRVLTPGQAWEVTRILEGVITEGTGAGYTSIGCGAEAGKTGTSEELSDAWFVGYTPMYSTAVWVGHPTTREETGFGGPTAGPIWQSYMSAAQGGECPQFEEPETLPELSAFNSDHTRSASEAYDSDELEETEEEQKAREKEEKREAKDEEKEEGESEPDPEPTPEPTPTPTPTPDPGPPPSVGGGISPG